MKTYKNLYPHIHSFETLYLAYRAANRNNNNPNNRNNNIGFRCAVSPGAFLQGQVRWVHGRGAGAQREELQTCSRLGRLTWLNQR